MKKNVITILISILVLSLILNGCGSSKSSIEDGEITLKIGATPLPHAEILNFVKPKLEEKGIKLEIIAFTDYVSPNLALDSKDIDANFFQHTPYMESFAKERNIEIVSAGKIHVEPLGLYSKKIKSIEELGEGDIITIPNDPSNEGRALILLHNQGIIQLKENFTLQATEKDIVSNPKKLIFKPIDAAQLPRSLEDVEAAIINTNYALEADFNPVDDSLLIEGSESPYANIITVRTEDIDNETIKTLVKILQSEEVRKFIEEKYEGAVVPAF